MNLKIQRMYPVPEVIDLNAAMQNRKRSGRDSKTDCAWNCTGSWLKLSLSLRMYLAMLVAAVTKIQTISVLVDLRGVMTKVMIASNTY